MTHALRLRLSLYMLQPVLGVLLCTVFYFVFPPTGTCRSFSPFVRYYSVRNALYFRFLFDIHRTIDSIAHFYLPMRIVLTLAQELFPFVPYSITQEAKKDNKFWSKDKWWNNRQKRYSFLCSCSSTNN